MNTAVTQFDLSRVLGGTRSLIIAVAVAAVAFSAFVTTGETSVQASQSKDDVAIAVQPDAATAQARIATAFAGVKFQPIVRAAVQPACTAKRVRVVYGGYGEAARQGCSQSAGL
jgi:hypothetical protein